MEFKTTTIEIDGATFRLRELNGLALDLAQQSGGETRQGYALLALSLCNDTGRPLYGAETLDEGLRWVMETLPSRVSRQLSDAVAALNFSGLDDARKN